VNVKKNIVKKNTYCRIVMFFCSRKKEWRSTKVYTNNREFNLQSDIRTSVSSVDMYLSGEKKRGFSSP